MIISINTIVITKQGTNVHKMLINTFTRKHSGGGSRVIRWAAIGGGGKTPPLTLWSPVPETNIILSHKRCKKVLIRNKLYILTKDNILLKLFKLQIYFATLPNLIETTCCNECTCIHYLNEFRRPHYYYNISDYMFI